MIGLVKVAALGAALSYGAFAVYERPLEAPRTPAAAKSAVATPVVGDETRPVRTSRRAAPAGPDCARVRRKLWVEAEGWVVRSVAVC